MDNHSVIKKLKVKTQTTTPRAPLLIEANKKGKLKSHLREYYDISIDVSGQWLSGEERLQ